MVVARDNEERPGDAHRGTGAGGENFTVNPPDITDSSWISGTSPFGQPSQPGMSGPVPAVSAAVLVSGWAAVLAPAARVSPSTR